MKLKGNRTPITKDCKQGRQEVARQAHTVIKDKDRRKAGMEKRATGPRHRFLPKKYLENKVQVSCTESRSAVDARLRNV